MAAMVAGGPEEMWQPGAVLFKHRNSSSLQNINTDFALKKKKKGTEVWLHTLLEVIIAAKVVFFWQ